MERTNKSSFTRESAQLKAKKISKASSKAYTLRTNVVAEKYEI